MALAAWLPLTVKGVILTTGMFGAPGRSFDVPCAMIVVPCGMDAIRVMVMPSPGVFVGGTTIQRPGSTWMPGRLAGSGSVTSVMAWR